MLLPKFCGAKAQLDIALRYRQNPGFSRQESIRLTSPVSNMRKASFGCRLSWYWPRFKSLRETKSTEEIALQPPLKENLRTKHLPNPLPVLPPSGLSFPEEVDDAYKQEDSLFFKLPYELRQQIYREALGGHFLHIVCTRKRLAHVSCSQREKRGRNTRSHDCWGYMAEDGLIWLRALSGQHCKHSSLMGIIRSCRRACASLRT